MSGWVGEGLLSDSGDRQYYQTARSGSRRYHVGDNVELFAGEEEEPFIGTIEEIFLEDGDDVQVNVRWLYRWEDISCPPPPEVKIQSPQEYLCSFHFDDNDPTTILGTFSVKYITPTGRKPTDSHYYVRYMYDHLRKLIIPLNESALQPPFPELPLYETKMRQYLTLNGAISKVPQAPIKATVTGKRKAVAVVQATQTASSKKSPKVVPKKKKAPRSPSPAPLKPTRATTLKSTRTTPKRKVISPSTSPERVPLKSTRAPPSKRRRVTVSVSPSPERKRKSVESSLPPDMVARMKKKKDEEAKRRAAAVPTRKTSKFEDDSFSESSESEGEPLKPSPKRVKTPPVPLGKPLLAGSSELEAMSQELVNSTFEGVDHTWNTTPDNIRTALSQKLMERSGAAKTEVCSS